MMSCHSVLCMQSQAARIRGLGGLSPPKYFGQKGSLVFFYTMQSSAHPHCRPTHPHHTHRPILKSIQGAPGQMTWLWLEGAPPASALPIALSLLVNKNKNLSTLYLFCWTMKQSATRNCCQQSKHTVLQRILLVGVYCLFIYLLNTDDDESTYPIKHVIIILISNLLPIFENSTISNSTIYM